MNAKISNHARAAYATTMSDVELAIAGRVIAAADRVRACGLFEVPGWQVVPLSTVEIFGDLAGDVAATLRHPLRLDLNAATKEDP